MTKKILISLSIIGIIAAIAVGGTIAYFSDTETSTGNTFTAGTIDISVNDMNPWNQSFTLADMKPCYTDYINFRINNNLSDPNPVNIFKKITVIEEGTGTVSEPECEKEGGIWGGQQCSDNTEDNDLSSMIWYDLSVEVYDSEGRIWWQTLYIDEEMKSIDNVYYQGTDPVNNQVFLGMIPAGGYMLVEQSYHLSPHAGNEYQGDTMTFDIEVEGVQLYGTAWLDNKEYAGGIWKVANNDDVNGVLTYRVKHPTFDFSFVGKAPLVSTEYVLAVGPNAADPTIELGRGTTDGSGAITIPKTSIELNQDVKDAKVWLIPATYWTGTAVDWASWPSMQSEFLWELGLIWYEDTDF